MTEVISETHFPSHVVRVADYSNGAEAMTVVTLSDQSAIVITLGEVGWYASDRQFFDGRRAVAMMADTDAIGIEIDATIEFLRSLEDEQVPRPSALHERIARLQAVRDGLP